MTPRNESPTPSPDRWSRVFVVGGLVCGLACGWLLLPQLLYSEHPQPLSFAHCVHTEDMGMACDECHHFLPDGSFAGLPDTEGCALCHNEALGESAAEAALVQDYIQAGREIPWQVYSRQPANVYFSHAAHVHLAEIECATCHGPRQPIGPDTPLPPLQINRISTYSRNIWGPRIWGGGAESWQSMKMSDCSGCHARRGVTDHCLMCHK